VADADDDAERGQVVAHERDVGGLEGTSEPSPIMATLPSSAVDPLETGRAVARGRLAASHVTVEFVGLDGQRLPLQNESADAALMTWTLCSIPDPVAAVLELRRVLRPGGALHFVEHGRSPHAKVQRWQHRLNGIQQRFACGCNLNRDIPGIIEASGFEITELDTYYAGGQPKTHGWTFRGIAKPADT
jgi:ubiquinone/menaquinone biosynthesis C-methylase UbiE